MIPPISRSLKIGLLGVVITAISFIAWKQHGFHDSQKTTSVHQDVPENSLGQPQQVAPTTALAPVHLPAPLHQPSEEELREFPGATVVEASETEGPKTGQKIQIRLLKTHFKYPLIRTKEVVDASKNEVVSRQEMVATHFLVTLPRAENPNIFLKKMGPLVTSMVRVTQDAPLYRANLTASSLGALPQALQQAAAVTKGVSESDFIGHACNTPNDLNFSGYPGSLRKNNFNTTADLDNQPSNIDAIKAWSLRDFAPSIIVAVVDTGIRYTHEDLAANMWHNPAPSEAGDIYGWNAYGNNGDPNDGYGHGTHCAGIIGAVGDNGIGISGVAWKVQLMACRWLDDNASGVESDAIVALDYARNHGAKILNCSWWLFSSQALFDALDRTRTAGMVVVVSAGNFTFNNDDFLNQDAKVYPAGCQLDNIVSVAATDWTDQLASFSSYGSQTVHLAAPGVNIYSTYNSSDSSYTCMSGTSMAAPHVAGALALMMQQSPNLSYQELISILLNSTDKLPVLAGKTISGGRLNVDSALAKLFPNVVAMKKIFSSDLSVMTPYDLNTGKREGSAPVTASTPAPLDKPSEEEWVHFPGAIVLEATEGDALQAQQKIRLRILTTKFKYPFLRTEEVIDTGKNNVITRQEMIADHLLVTLPEEEDADDFLKKFGEQATSMERVTQDARVYRLQLASSSLEALPQALARATTLTKGACEPDFISHGNVSMPNISQTNPFFNNMEWGLCGLHDNGDPLDPKLECHGCNAEDAWKLSNSAASIIVAVIDSGIRYKDANLESNIWLNLTPTHGDLHGWNAYSNSGDPMDDCGHGTLCADVIGAASNPFNTICGVVQKVQLMACKISDEHNCSVTSDEVVGIDYAHDHGAKILNYTRSNSAYSQACFDAMNRARSAGAIVVMAAGNDSSNNDMNSCYPSHEALDNMVTVAAMSKMEGLADFSNYGTKTVHLAAPGDFAMQWGDYSSLRSDLRLPLPLPAGLSRS